MWRNWGQLCGNSWLRKENRVFVTWHCHNYSLGEFLNCDFCKNCGIHSVWRFLWCRQTVLSAAPFTSSHTLSQPHKDSLFQMPKVERESKIVEGQWQKEVCIWQYQCLVLRAQDKWWALQTVSPSCQRVQFQDGEPRALYQAAHCRVLVSPLFSPSVRGSKELTAWPLLRGH